MAVFEMRCFAHPEKDAVGLCRICERGLCKDCAIEYDDFLFCKKHADAAILAGSTREELLQKAQPVIKQAKAKAIEARPISKPQPVKATVSPQPERPQKALIPLEQKYLVSPILLGGIVSGTASGIPFLNLACFIWAVAGGALASYLFTFKESVRIGKPVCIATKDAMLLGAASGMVGAIIAFVISMLAGVNLWQPLFDAFISSGFDLSTSDSLMRILTADPHLELIPLVLKLVALMIILPIFGAIGGVLTTRAQE